MPACGRPGGASTPLPPAKPGGEFAAAVGKSRPRQLLFAGNDCALRSPVNISDSRYSRLRHPSSRINYSSVISAPPLLLAQCTSHNIPHLSNGGDVNSSKPSTVPEHCTRGWKKACRTGGGEKVGEVCGDDGLEEYRRVWKGRCSTADISRKPKSRQMR